MIFLKTEKLNRKEDKLMRKEAFISLFLERLVRALDGNIKNLEFRRSASGEEYILVNYHNEPPYTINLTGLQILKLL